MPIIWDDQQQEAAKVLLASAESAPAPPIHQNSFTAKRSATESALADRFAADMKRVRDAVRRCANMTGRHRQTWKMPCFARNT